MAISKPNWQVSVAYLLGSTVSLLVSTAEGGDWAAYQKTESVEIFAEYGADVNGIVTQLHAVKAEFRTLLDLPVPEQNVQVIIFNSPRSYRKYLQKDIPEALHRRAIFYRNKNIYQIYAYRHRDLIEDLRHEYTHALLHQSLPYIPLWIDEGLAEFMEDQPGDRAGSSRLAGMKWRCRSGWQPSLGNVERIQSAASMNSAEYRDSWAWIHFLMNDSDASRQMLQEYLQAISAGEAPGAFSEWSSQRAPEVTKRIGSYFRRFRISLR